MSRTVFLHVGAPKTGTTYLQARLARNARSLRAHDVHYPSRNPISSPGLSHFRAALDLLGQDWGGDPGHAKGAWDALVRRVRRLDGTVVISHETLAPATPQQVARALHDLRDSEVHVVYSARDLGRQVPAAWQESVKQGRTWSYRSFHRRLSRGRTWWARAFDLPEVLDTWGAGLPPERVHVLTVPHEPGDLLWQRFCALLGADPAWAPAETAAANRSMGVAETTLVRRLNQRLDSAQRQDIAYDRVVRETLAQGTLANRRSTRVQLPPGLHPWAVAEAERWRAWVLERGVDVVGDLDDLLPAPPVATDEYADPEQTSSKAQLDAALDALAVLTAEAARREDPERRPQARIRRRLERGW